MFCRKILVSPDDSFAFRKSIPFFGPPRHSQGISRKKLEEGGGNQNNSYCIPSPSPQFPLFLPPSASQKRKSGEMSEWHDRRGRRKEKVAPAVLTKERREGEEAERHFLFLPPQFFMPKNLFLLRPPGTLVMRGRKCTETKGTIQQRRNVEFLIVCRRKMESRVQPKKLIARCGPCEEEGGLLDGIWN